MESGGGRRLMCSGANVYHNLQRARITKTYKAQYLNPLKVNAGEAISVGDEDVEFPHGDGVRPTIGTRDGY